MKGSERSSARNRSGAWDGLGIPNPKQGLKDLGMANPKVFLGGIWSSTGMVWRASGWTGLRTGIDSMDVVMGGMDSGIGGQ